MMKEEGKLLEIKGKEAVIEIEPKEACSKCCSCSAAKTRHITVDAELVKGFSPGDIVEVDIEASSMMGIYGLLYGLPLVVFVGALLFAHVLTASPIVSFAAALIATIGVYLLIGFILKKFPGLTPEVNVCKKK